MHMRQHFVRVHIDKALRDKLKLTKRTVQISKGDTVKVMAGSKKGTTGKVVSVSLRTGKITLDNLSRKTTRGKEIKIQISASNVYITDLNLSDKYRAAKLKVAHVPQQKPAPATAAPKKEEPAAPQLPKQDVQNKMEQKAAAGL